MDTGKVIAYVVLGVALYNIFYKSTPKPKEASEQKPQEEQKSPNEPQMNMTGFAYCSGYRDEGVNGVSFEGNMNFFD